MNKRQCGEALLRLLALAAGLAGLAVELPAQNAVPARAAALPAPQRAVLGGRAVAMVADLVYAFPQIRPRVAAIAGTDQGLGDFLASLDRGFRDKAPLDRQAGAESYAALKPDLVVMKSIMKKTLGEQLDALGLRQLYLGLESPEDYYRDIAALGAAFGQEARAGELAGWYRARVDEVAAGVAADPGAKPRVLLVQASRAAGGSFEVPPRSWMQTGLVVLAGGIPVWLDANPGNGWGRVGFEQIAAWNPDVLVVVNYAEGVDAVADGLRADPRFAGLACGSAGRIVGFPQDFHSWDQPDTRWILGLQWLARQLHPAAFRGGSALDDARAFYRAVYGMADDDFDRVIRPRLKGDLAPR